MVSPPQDLGKRGARKAAKGSTFSGYSRGRFGGQHVDRPSGSRGFISRTTCDGNGTRIALPRRGLSHCLIHAPPPSRHAPDHRRPGQFDHRHRRGSGPAARGASLPGGRVPDLRCRRQHLDRRRRPRRWVRGRNAALLASSTCGSPSIRSISSNDAQPSWSWRSGAGTHLVVLIVDGRGGIGVTGLDLHLGDRCGDGV